MNTQKVTQEYRMNQWSGIIREYHGSGQTETLRYHERFISSKM